MTHARAGRPSGGRGGFARGLLVLGGVVVLLAVAVGAVVVILRSGESAAPRSSGCSAGGHTVALDQGANAALIVGTTVRRDLPARAGTIGIATALQESWMRNIDFGDRDSLGMFQQRPSQGWGTPEQVMDPVYAVNIFYDHLVRVAGYTEMAVTEAAQAVQRSGFPDAYAKHEPLARGFAQALSGWTEADLTCAVETFEGDPAGVAAAVIARSERDYGVVGRVEPWPDGADGVAAAVLDAAALGRPDGDTERLAWAIAQGAVGAASETGAGSVWVADSVWERASGQWRLAEADEGTPARGIVVVTP